MEQKKILVPTENAESWRKLLAKPNDHWKADHSAMSIALCWEAANDLPPEIKSLFRGSSDHGIKDAELAIAIPEYKVDLAGGSKPSQNDIFALLTSSGGLISMMVEGKAHEHFDKTLDEWKESTSKKGAHERLPYILDHIGLTEPLPGNIRYQLLHRTASAVIEAKRFHANYAVLLIQSFVEKDTENHYDDFKEFLALYGEDASKHVLIPIASPHDCKLYAAWVQSKILRDV